jgi:hypothetical protein
MRIGRAGKNQPSRFTAVTNSMGSIQKDFDWVWVHCPPVMMLFLLFTCMSLSPIKTRKHQGVVELRTGSRAVYAVPFDRPWEFDISIYTLFFMCLFGSEEAYQMVWIFFSFAWGSKRKAINWEWNVSWVALDWEWNVSWVALRSDPSCDHAFDCCLWIGIFCRLFSSSDIDRPIIHRWSPLELLLWLESSPSPTTP